MAVARRGFKTSFGEAVILSEAQRSEESRSGNVDPAVAEPPSG